VLDRDIKLESGTVRVARDVQPVPSPALAVMLRSEQPVDQILVSVRRGILDELLHFSRRRQQTQQIEVGAPDQRPSIGLWGRYQALLLHLVPHKSVDRIAAPAAIADLGRRIPYRLLESPPVALFVGKLL